MQSAYWDQLLRLVVFEVFEYGMSRYLLVCNFLDLLVVAEQDEYDGDLGRRSVDLGHPQSNVKMKGGHCYMLE